MNEVSSNRLRP